MLHAFKLYTGPDNASHVQEGTIGEHITTQVASIRFRESPPGSSFDWHDAPHIQYVITLAGTLEFMTRDGETFILRTRRRAAGKRQRRERPQVAVD